jgi:hypothetical protein
MKPYWVKPGFLSRVFLLLCVALWQLGQFSAGAVIDARSLTNTSAPADGAPWANVGTVNTASAIYLGAGWALTAHHVGPGDLNLGGTVFPWNNISIRLTNADGSSNDLVMFQLKALPPLPRLSLATTTPSALAHVDMIGYGRIAGSTQTNFGLGLNGFYWSSSPAKSWGNNAVDTGGTVVLDAGQGPVTLFSTTFSQLGQTSDEAQAAPGDSGGGVFQKPGSTWQLAGMTLYVSSSLPNQPANTSVYGQQTYAANIATYFPQIITLITNTVPTLSLSQAGTNVLVCWPDTSVTWDLCASHSLTATNWPVLNPALTLTNGQYCVLVPATNNPTFFRLQKQVFSTVGD